MKLLKFLWRFRFDYLKVWAFFFLMGLAGQSPHTPFKILWLTAIFALGISLFAICGAVLIKKNEPKQLKKGG